MNPKNKIKNAAKAGLAGIVAIYSLFTNAQNSNHEATTARAAEQNSFDSRAKVEYSGNVKDNLTISSTFGIASNGTFDQPVPLFGQFVETFRLCDVYKDANGQESHYTAAGIRMPSFNIGDITNNVLVFGSIDSLKGVGIEGEHSLKKATFTWNAEQESENNATRLGLGLQYQLLPNLSFDAGYDSVNINGALEERINGRVMFDIGKHNFGLGFLRVENDNPNTHVGGFYVLKGDSKEFGIRAIGDMAFFDNGDKNAWAQLILAQKNTSGKLGALTIIDRRASQDGGYNSSVVPLSISKFENISPSDRTASGLALVLEGSYSKNEKSVSWSINPNIVYHFEKPIIGGNLGVFSGISYSFDGMEDKEKTCLTGGLVYRLANKFELDAGFSAPFNQQQDPSLRVAIQYVF